MRVLITGASGWIGAALTQRLLLGGHEVTAIVRRPQALPLPPSERLHLISGDLLDVDVVHRAMRGCTQLYHLAAFAKVWTPDDRTYFEQNVTATNNLLTAAQQASIDRMVHVGTAGIWGPSIRSVVDEQKVRDIDFFNAYESSKAMADLAVKDAVIQTGLDAVIVSPTRVYGPALSGKPQGVTQLIDKYVRGSWRWHPGDGTRVGNYVYIDDVVDGLLLAMEHGAKGETYLLAGENSDYIHFFKRIAELSGIHRTMLPMPSWLQMAFAQVQLALAKTVGREPLITPSWSAKGLYDWEVDGTKAQRALGLRPTSLDEGIRKTVSWLSQL